MKCKTLGNTGLLVSQLCLGTMTFSGGTGIFKHIGNVDQAGAGELVKASIDAGIKFFDTADVYSGGESETTLGQSFKNLGIARKNVVLATKVYSRMGGGQNDVGASRGHIMDAVEASLARLQTDHIDPIRFMGLTRSPRPTAYVVVLGRPSPKVASQSSQETNPCPAERNSIFGRPTTRLGRISPPSSGVRCSQAASPRTASIQTRPACVKVWMPGHAHRGVASESARGAL